MWPILMAHQLVKWCTVKILGCLIWLLWCFLDENDNDVMTVAVGHDITQKVKRKIAGMSRVKRGFTVDSGAADNVMPIGWIIGMMICKSIGSVAGLMYVAANGSKIPNVGQTSIEFMSGDGTWSKWIFQLAAINKPLVSVSKLIEGGYRVIFDETGSYIEHKKTKERINMRKERGVFIVDAYVKKGKKDTANADALFSRRG